jgi:hypothetical protein
MGSGGGQSGHTLMETIVALLVFSAALYSFWGLSLRLGDGYLKARAAGAAALRAEGFDRRLRALCARARPSFWTPIPASSFSPDRMSVRIPFMDGDGGLALRIDAMGADAILGAGDASIRVRGVKIAGITPLMAEGGALAGIRVEYATGGRNRECRALFGGYSLSQAAMDE